MTRSSFGRGRDGRRRAIAAALAAGRSVDCGEATTAVEKMIRGVR